MNNRPGNSTKPVVGRDVNPGRFLTIGRSPTDPAARSRARFFSPLKHWVGVADGNAATPFLIHADGHHSLERAHEDRRRSFNSAAHPFVFFSPVPRAVEFSSARGRAAFCLPRQIPFAVRPHFFFEVPMNAFGMLLRRDYSKRTPIYANNSEACELVVSLANYEGVWICRAEIAAHSIAQGSGATAEEAITNCEADARRNHAALAELLERTKS